MGLLCAEIDAHSVHRTGNEMRRSSAAVREYVGLDISSSCSGLPCSRSLSCMAVRTRGSMIAISAIHGGVYLWMEVIESAMGDAVMREGYA